MELEFSELKGMKLVGSSGKVIGTVEDIKVETEDWRSRALVVSVDRNIEEYLELEPRNTPFFSFTSLFREASIEIPTSRISKVSEDENMISLDMSIEELREYFREIREARESVINKLGPDFDELPKEEKEALLRKLAHDDSVDIRSRVAYLLAIGSEEVDEETLRLLYHLANDKAPRVRENIVLGLLTGFERIPRGIAEDLLQKLSKDSSHVVRRGVARIIAKHFDELSTEAHTIFRELADDPHQRVRGFVARAISKEPDKFPKDYQELIEARPLAADGKGARRIKKHAIGPAQSMQTQEQNKGEKKDDVDPLYHDSDREEEEY